MQQTTNRRTPKTRPNHPTDESPRNTRRDRNVPGAFGRREPTEFMFDSEADFIVARHEFWLEAAASSEMPAQVAA